MADDEHLVETKLASEDVFRGRLLHVKRDTVRLPDALFWLYPLLRPVGWLVRRWQRSSR